MKPTKGFRRMSRKKLKAGLRDKFTATHYIRQFKEGERVVIKINPSSHRSMPMPKYAGLSGTVKSKEGRIFRVLIKDGGKEKELVVAPEHLRSLESA